MATDLLVLIAAGFGLGFSPLLPDTVGALLGLPLSYGLSRLPLHKQLAAVLCLALVAVLICGRASQRFAVEDASPIVADEYLAFPIATLALPCAKHPALLVTAFVASRTLDYVKLYPATRVERAPGGVGMVLDDVVSNVYALGLTWLGFAAFSRRRQGSKRRNADNGS